jgi:hypothetical protein
VRGIRLLRTLWFLYLMTIFAGLTVTWTGWVVILIVKLAEGHHFTAADEGVLWPLAALSLLVIPGCGYATRWLWRRWRCGTFRPS